MSLLDGLRWKRVLKREQNTLSETLQSHLGVPRHHFPGFEKHQPALPQAKVLKDQAQRLQAQRKGGWVGIFRMKPQGFWMILMEIGGKNAGFAVFFSFWTLISTKLYRTSPIWLVVSNMNFIFHFIYGNVITPTDFNSIMFQDGYCTTNQPFFIDGRNLWFSWPRRTGRSPVTSSLPR